MKIEDVYALSPLQEGLYYHWLRSPEAYFEQTTYQLKGELNSGVLEKSYQLLVERHAILRTVFTTNFGEKVLQVVRKEGIPSFRYIDVSADTEFSLDDFKLADRAQGFDLNKGALMRLTVLFHGNNTYTYIWSHHHILMDGWCMSILIKEFFQLYHYLLHNAKPVLPKVYPYSAYIKWLEQVDEKKSLQYWTDYLADYHSVSPLQPDIPLQRESYAAKEFFMPIDDPLRQRIKSLCESVGVTENILVQALWGILLSKYNNTTDVVFGSVVSGRPAEIAGIEQMIGLFINTIPVRVQAPAQTLFSHLLITMQQASVESSRHHYTQLATVLAASEPGSQLFDHILVFENYPVQDMIAHDVETSSGKMPIELLSVESYEQSNYNFSLAIVSGREMSFRFTYNGNVYTSAFIERLSRHFRHLLEQVITCPETAIANIDFLSETEREALLTWGTGITGGEQPWVNKTIIPLFNRQAELTPEATAVEFENVQLTYRELDNLSNQFAAFLITQFGVNNNDLVAIQLPRSEWILISILAIWKSGGAYVPIDLQYPQERVNYILEDSRCKVQINAAVLALFHRESHQYATMPLSVRGDAKDIAYVIYTSGSTGKPKGVQVTQESLVSFAISNQLTFGKKHPVVMPLLASYAFDIFLFETLLPLLSGGTAMMISEEQVKDIPYLATQLKKANAFHAVPAFMAQIIQYILSENNQQEFEGIKDLFVGGDTVPSNVLKVMYATCSQADIHVLYGPTESTIFVTARHYIHGRSSSFNGATIGRPNRNALVYITDAYGALAPEGVVGEICIGGPGVASGYLHQPALNTEKFIPDPFLHRGTMYRTGDLGKWLPDGNLTFAGRMDGQVKIRGYRIELGEIESVLQNYPGIDESVIVVQIQETGDKELIAFMVSEALPSLEGLRTHLSAVLPAYMIPAQFVLLKQLPLTPNGKVDKKALQEYNISNVNNGTPYLPPRNIIEEKLVLIWQSILGKEKIGIYDDFFALGGHSLKITRLSSQLRKELDVEISIKALFVTSRLEDQALLIQQSKREAQLMIMPAAVQESYPLSSSQRRVWLMSQFHDGNAAYNMPAMYILEGSYDHISLEYAFEALMQRHEILRTAFKEDRNGDVRQFILPPAKQDFRISFADLRSQKQQEESLQALIQSEFLQPFDFTKYTLLRAGVFQLADNKWAFVFVMHHIISDGWSMGILINELFALYHARKANLMNTLPSLSIQYKDYAVWQQEQLETGLLHTQQTYWLKQLGGELPVLEMPLDKPRPAIRTYNGDTIKTMFNTVLTRQLTTLSRQQGTTTFMSLLSLVSALLYRYTNQEDMIIGSPIAGREHSNLEDQIGFYLNTLPLRIPINEHDSYNMLLEKIKKITLDAYEYQAYPFDELVDALVKKRDQSRNPLFDVMLVLQNTDSHAVYDDQLGELKISAYDISGKPSSKFDLLFEFVEAADTIQVNIEYNSDIFNHATIVQLSRHLEQLLVAVLSTPSAPISTIDYLTDQEKEILLFSFNDTAVDYPGFVTIATLFEAQVDKTPNNRALIFETVSLTYRELNIRANQLAHFLQNQYHIQPDDLIGIDLMRSEWLIIVILGILKSGGGYMPLEPSYPKHRTDYMIADSDCKLVIDETLLAQFLTVSSQYATSNPITATTAAHLAYVMYTSGSAGRPKGVMVEQRNVIRLVKCINFMALTGEETLLSTSAVSFDAATFEYWSMLLNGGCLILCTEEALLQAECLTAIISEKEVDTMWFSASKLHQLIDDDIEVFKDLKFIIAGGERLSPLHLNVLMQHYPSLRIINGYGPTENTTFSLTYELYQGLSIIPLGKPIQNSTAYILGPQLQLCPIGIVGEIYVGGDGVSRGYQNQPLLTTVGFPENPYGTGRIYQTGDLGKWLPDGNIVFLGRKDEQVKINGFRVEPGEIEVVIQHYPGIDAVLVLAKDITKDYRDNRIFLENDISEKVKESEDLKDILLPDQTEYAGLPPKADQTNVLYDKHATIVSLFAKAVLQFPERIALVVDDRVITYKELDQRSGQLARLLVTAYDVKAEDLIALHFDRNEWMLIGILGVLKAGGAYIPIDPSYPAARIDYILEDSKSRLLLYDLAPQIDGTKQINCLDITSVAYTGEPVTIEVQPHHLAYIIYTSGTTGQPKGVLIEHRNVTRLLFNNDDLFDFDEYDVWSLFHSYCFDFSVWEMYGALLKGGKLVMVPKVIAQDSMTFFNFLSQHKITILNQTPTAFRSLVQLNKDRFLSANLSIRYLIFGGEALRMEILKEWQESFTTCRIINMYGITETTVHVTYKEITSKEIEENRSNIGLPIPTLSCYILDINLQPVPIGVAGELCVGGAGVARGYLNKPELTAERFIPHPLYPGERLYRSGDYARILPSGDIEYLGRKDEQVKIRGYRIETGEIESVLLKVAGIDDVAVLPVKIGMDEYELAAYFIPAAGYTPDLRKELQNKIPGYMIPAYFIALSSFPLNKNGKLDKDALPAPMISTMKQDVLTDRYELNGSVKQEKQLIAYFVAQTTVSPVDIKTFLLELLPDYMIPFHFVQLHAFPLTPNGKVDLCQLPMPKSMVHDGSVAYQAPRNETEAKLVELWQEILGREAIGIRDNFFELGGQSIKAARLAGRIRQVFDIQFSLVLLFDHPTIENTAAEIEKIYWANKEVLETEDGDRFSI